MNKRKNQKDNQNSVITDYVLQHANVYVVNVFKQLNALEFQLKKRVP